MEGKGPVEHMRLVQEAINKTADWEGFDDKHYVRGQGGVADGAPSEAARIRDRGEEGIAEGAHSEVTDQE